MAEERRVVTVLFTDVAGSAALNVASRLQQQSEPRGILCGQRTVASARAGFEFGPVVMVEVRGKLQPIAALPLLGRAATGRVAARRPAIMPRWRPGYGFSKGSEMPSSSASSSDLR